MNYTISYSLNDASTYGSNKSLDKSCRSIQVLAEKSEIDQLVNQGYLLINDLFDSAILEKFRSALDRISADEYENPKTEHLKGVGHYVRYLLDKDPVFHSLLFMERPLSIGRAVLGPQIYLDVEARLVPANIPDMALGWHIHHRVVPEPLPPFFCYPHAIHGLLYLDDIDLATGPICLLPGSHLKPHLLKARSESDVEGQLVLPVKAGTCLLMHANLWHKTLPTTNNARQRRLILFSLTPSWLRPDFGHGVIPNHRLRDNLLQGANAEFRELLGEFNW